jgi:hypothetical protein
MRPTYISDSGEPLPEGSSLLSDKFITSRDRTFMRNFLVKQGGFVHLEPRGRTLCITLDPNAVSVNALSGLLYLVHDFKAKSFALSYEHSGQAIKLIPSRAHLHTVIGNLLTERLTASEYNETPIDISESAFARNWAAASKVLELFGPDTKTTRVFDTLFDGHWTISEYDGKSASYRFIAVGDWYRKFDAELADQLVGKSASSLGDQSLGKKVEEGLVQTRRLARPSTTRVTTTLKWRNKEPKLMHFHRLLLPVSRNATSGFMISAAAVL